jgi:DNA primase
MIDFESLDIESFFSEHDIETSNRGKNVGKDWIGIDCPFCGGSGFHGGVNRDHKGFSCWQCGETADPIKLVRELLDMQTHEAIRALEPFASNRPVKKEVKQHKATGKVNRIIVPGYTLTDVGKNYLINRNFNPDMVVRDFYVQETGPAGDYKYRIMIPVIMNKQIVTFQGRDYTGKQEQRYKALPNERSIVPIKESVYNIDTVDDKVLILEGPTDVWRMGAGSICLCGVKYSQAQINALMNRGIKKAVVMFDAAASREADLLAIQLTSFIDDVKILFLDSGDPADLSYEEAMNLKRDIL